MKSKLTRMLAFALALVLALSLCGCSKKVSVKGTKVCGEFNISGELKDSGTAKITGTVFDKWGHKVTLSNKNYSYTKSGNNVTFRLKGIGGPSVITGIYSNGKFTLTNEGTIYNYCMIYGNL